MSNEGRALEDLVSLPTIPKEAGRKIAQLEHEFVRAETEQRTFYLSFISRFNLLSFSKLRANVRSAQANPRTAPSLRQAQ
jgi:hypothetical protein